MVIGSSIVIRKGLVAKNNSVIPELSSPDTTLLPEKFYDYLQSNYPKFFKMDKLCKWAVAGAEYLFSTDQLYKDIDKPKIALALATSHGCIDVDKRYFDGIAVPSPALFVYTLPNIMLGEISIRYGFKGEQLCMVSDSFDADELYFTAHEMIMNRNMDACLCGWVDVAADQYDVYLLWVSGNGTGTDFNPETIKRLYNRNV